MKKLETIVKEVVEKFQYPYNSIEAVARNLDVEEGFYENFNEIKPKNIYFEESFGFIGKLYYCSERKILFKLVIR